MQQLISSKQVIWILVSVFVSSSSVYANEITTIDFEEPDLMNFDFLPIPYQQNGFTVSSDDPFGSFLVIDEGGAFFTGSQAVTTFAQNASVTFSIDDPGKSFIPLTIDLAEFGDERPITISVTGTTQTEATVFDTIITDGETDFGSADTYAFSLTQPLRSLSFQNKGLLFDNFRVRVTAVPEPNSLLTLGLASVALAAFRKRRNQQLLDEPWVATEAAS